MSLVFTCMYSKISHNSINNASSSSHNFKTRKDMTHSVISIDSIIFNTLGQTYKCAVEQNETISLFMNEITAKLRNMRLYLMFIKQDIDFFKSTIIPCATAADAKTTELHVENVQAQIEKIKNDTSVVQSYVSLKNIKWAN